MLDKTAYNPASNKMTLIFNYTVPETKQTLDFMVDNIVKNPKTYDIILKIIEGIPILCVAKDSTPESSEKETVVDVDSKPKEESTSDQKN